MPSHEHQQFVQDWGYYMSSFGTFPVSCKSLIYLCVIQLKLIMSLHTIQIPNEATNANMQDNAVHGFTSQSEFDLPLSAVSDYMVKLN